MIKNKYVHTYLGDFYFVFSAQGNIIACVFSGVNSLRNSQQCPTMTAFVRLEQETVTLISELQQICGNGKF